MGAGTDVSVGGTHTQVFRTMSASRRPDRRLGEKRPSFTRVFLLSLRRALELDPSLEDGFYERPRYGDQLALSNKYKHQGMAGGVVFGGSIISNRRAYKRLRAANDRPEQFVHKFLGRALSALATPTTCCLSDGHGREAESATIPSTNGTN